MVGNEWVGWVMSGLWLVMSDDLVGMGNEWAVEGNE